MHKGEKDGCGMWEKGARMLFYAPNPVQMSLDLLGLSPSVIIARTSASIIARSANQHPSYRPGFTAGGNSVVVDGHLIKAGITHSAPRILIKPCSRHFLAWNNAYCSGMDSVAKIELYKRNTASTAYLWQGWKKQHCTAQGVITSSTWVYVFREQRRRGKMGSPTGCRQVIFGSPSCDWFHEIYSWDGDLMPIHSFSHLSNWLWIPWRKLSSRLIHWTNLMSCTWGSHMEREELTPHI